MARAFLLGGFALVVVGVAMLSVPAACITAGVVLFVSGGLELRRKDTP